MQKFQRIFLIGFMGSGKSATGEKIAQKLQKKFIDTDIEIEKKAGLTIPEIFSQKGEEYFRNIEEELLKELVTNEKEAVIACGGGIVERASNRDLLKKELTIYLYAPWNELWERISQDPHRPLVKKGEKWVKELYHKREKLYREAGISLDTSGLSIDDIVKKILELLKYDNLR